jgi:glutamate dehydrogenase (NADP+)
MSQNARKMPMKSEEVYVQLEGIMQNIHDSSAAASKEYGFGYNLVAGANIAGFLKIAEAMTAQGYV